MASKYSITSKFSALLLVLAVAQVYVLADSSKALFGQPVTTVSLPTPLPQAIMGKLTTRGNEPVSVNGINVTSGATIMSGANIETGDGVGASVNLGPLGSIDIAPNSKVQVEFSEGRVKVTILQGCAIVRNKKGTFAQIYTEKGLATQNDPNQKQAGVLDICMPQGAPAPLVNQGAAANAGAGAGGGGGAGAGGGGVAGAAAPSIGKIFSIGLPIIGGAAALAVIVPCRRGRNPSPGVPRGRNDECR